MDLGSEERPGAKQAYTYGRATPRGRAAAAYYLDALRFVRGSVRPSPDIRTREVEVDPVGPGDAVRATLLEPEAGRPVPGWVVLHGLTRPGRAHPSLLRFTRALASTGGRVLVPEIPEWTRLSFAPERALGIIRGAVAQLAGDPATKDGGVVLVGFSFGAPQALMVGADEEFRTRLRGVVGWGGYADLRRTFLFQFTGKHEWDGRTHHLRPDPYGRWVVGANCLTLDVGLGDTTPVAEALRTLALDAGERQVAAWDPIYRPLERHLRRTLPRRIRPVFDLFVHPDGGEPDPAASVELVERMMPAARSGFPRLDPLPFLERVNVPVRLLHPRDDHLVPFTETLALARWLEGRVPEMRTAITGLIGHSGRRGGGGMGGWVREAAGFLSALAGIFEMAKRAPAQDAGRESDRDPVTEPLSAVD